MRSRSCRHHPRALAGWSCEGCAALLCPDCVVRSQVRATDFDACAGCGGTVSLLTRHRAEANPFAGELLRAMSLPFGVEGATSLLVTGGAVGLLLWMTEATFIAMKPFVLLLCVGVLFGWFFHVVKAASIGADPFDAPDFRDFFGDVVAPGARALFALSFIWAIPLVLSLERTGEIFSTREAIAFWVYAWAYAPIALMLAAFDHAGGSLNPVIAALHARRLGREYLLLLGALVPLAALEGLLWKIDAAGWLDRLGFIGAWAIDGALLYPVFVTAYLLGKLLYLHGDRIDYGRAEDYQVPVLEGAVPRGTPALPARAG